MTTHTTDRQLVTILVVVLGALVVLPLLFMGVGMMGVGMMGGMWGGGSGLFPIVGLVMQLLFLGVLVAAGYLVYRAVAGSSVGSDRALEELRLAYARGDLSDEEYERRREALERDG